MSSEASRRAQHQVRDHLPESGVRQSNADSGMVNHLLNSSVFGLEEHLPHRVHAREVCIV